MLSLNSKSCLISCIIINIFVQLLNFFRQLRNAAMNVRREDAESALKPARDHLIRLSSTVTNETGSPASANMRRQSSFIRNEFIPQGLQQQQRKSIFLRGTDEVPSAIRLMANTSNDSILRSPIKLVGKDDSFRKEPIRPKKQAIVSVESILKETLLPYTVHGKVPAKSLLNLLRG